MPSCGFCHFCGSQSENKRKRKDKQTFGPCQRTKKALKHKVNVNTNCAWCTSNGLKGPVEGTGETRNQSENWSRPEYGIDKIG